MATPMLFVRTPSTWDAVQFYRRPPFSAQDLGWNLYPGRLDTDQSVSCFEMKIGSSSLMISDFAGDCAPPGNACLRLECSNLHKSLEAAKIAGCTVVHEPEDERFRPGVTVATITDIYGHTWQLCNSSDCLGDRGFLNKEDMRVLVVDDGDREGIEFLFNAYKATPRVLRMEAYSTADEVMERQTWERTYAYDPVMINSRNVRVSEVWRDPQEHSFTGNIVGLLEDGDDQITRELFNASGCNRVIRKDQLTREALGELLVDTLRKQKQVRQMEEHRRLVWRMYEQRRREAQGEGNGGD